MTGFPEGKQKFQSNLVSGFVVVAIDNKIITFYSDSQNNTTQAGINHKS